MAKKKRKNSNYKSGMPKRSMIAIRGDKADVSKHGKSSPFHMNIIRTVEGFENLKPAIAYIPGYHSLDFLQLIVSYFVTYAHEAGYRIGKFLTWNDAFLPNCFRHAQMPHRRQRALSKNRRKVCTEIARPAKKMYNGIKGAKTKW